MTSKQTIYIPGSCPTCGARTCVEWDWSDVTLTTIHCRAQHATPAMCDFREPLGIEAGRVGYTIITVDGDELPVTTIEF